MPTPSSGQGPPVYHFRFISFPNHSIYFPQAENRKKRFSFSPLYPPLTCIRRGLQLSM